MEGIDSPCLNFPSLERDSDSDGWYTGAAGWGLLWIEQYFNEGQDPKYLEAANRLADRLSYESFQELTSGKTLTIEELGAAKGLGGIASFLRANDAAQRGQFRSLGFFWRNF